MNVDEQDALLAKHCRRRGDRWYFDSPVHTHTREAALAIIEACLLLEMPVTDVVTAETFLRLVDQVAYLTERLSRLETARNHDTEEDLP